MLVFVLLSGVLHGVAQDVGMHSFSISPLGLISPSRQTINATDFIDAKRHIHWDYMYRYNARFSYRVGLDDMEETYKEYWWSGRTYYNKRSQGVYLGGIVHSKSDYKQPFSLSISGQLGIFRSNYIQEVYHYTKFVGIRPVKVGVTPEISTGTIWYTSTRVSAYLGIRISKNIFAFLDPSLILNQYHENGEVSRIDAFFGSDRIVGIGFRI